MIVDKIWICDSQKALSKNFDYSFCNFHGVDNFIVVSLLSSYIETIRNWRIKLFYFVLKFSFSRLPFFVLLCL